MPMLTLLYLRCLGSLFGAYRGALEGALRCMVIGTLAILWKLSKWCKTYSSKAVVTAATVAA